MDSNAKDQGQTKTGKTPFITASTAREAYEEAKRWMRPYFEPIDELERIARNRPSGTIPKDLPKVTDGTLAAIVQEQPKRIIQQTPDGLVVCRDYPEYAMVADYDLRNKLVPMSHNMGSELQKDWNMLGKAMTWGRSTSYSFFTTTNGIRHVDWVIPYVKDILTEKGKVYGPDSNVRFMRSWYQKRDLKAIIEREKWLMSKNKDYEPGWNLKMLAEFMESGASSKTAEVMTPAEREKGGDNGGFEVIHAYQNGKEAEFYSFAPRFKDGESLRRKINNDPRGMTPFDDLYCNIDLSSPLGRGQVELSGGVQNLIDQQMQMYQFVTTMNMGPVVITSGNVNHASLKYRPNAIWKKGSPNDTIEIAKMDNTFINNYPNNYGLLKSQILNLNSAQDHSISSDAGNPQQSKTQAGVKAQESRLGVSDNYLRKQFETWDAAKKETQINIYFSEMTGNSNVHLDANDMDKLLKSESAQYVDREKRTLNIPYSKINAVVFNFEVDPDSSQVSEDNDNAEKLMEVMKLLTSVPDPALQAKIPLLAKMIVDEIGAEGTDDLFPELSKDENPEAMQQQQAPQGPDPAQLQQMVQEMVQQGIQEAMQSQDVAFKQQQNELKGREIDLKERQFEVDTELRADKQEHDKAMDGAKQDRDDLQTIQSLAEGGGEDDAEDGEQPDEEPDYGADELQEEETALVQALIEAEFDDNDIEQGVIMLRQGMDDQQVFDTLMSKRGAVA